MVIKYLDIQINASFSNVHMVAGSFVPTKGSEVMAAALIVWIGDVSNGLSSKVVKW